jgi:hypothetical protein
MDIFVGACFFIGFFCLLAVIGALLPIILEHFWKILLWIGVIYILQHFIFKYW